MQVPAQQSRGCAQSPPDRAHVVCPQSPSEHQASWQCPSLLQLPLQQAESLRQGLPLSEHEAHSPALQPAWQQTPRPHSTVLLHDAGIPSRAASPAASPASVAASLSLIAPVSALSDIAKTVQPAVPKSAADPHTISRTR
jgi:hypothetical protein